MANARLDRTPEWLTFWFSERPEPRFTSIKLLDSAGAAVALGDVTRVAGNDSGVTLRVTGALAPGRYSVTWRTAAADGHPSSGRFGFVVTGNAAVAPPVSAPVDTQPAAKANALTGPIGESFDGFGAAERWAELIAILTIIGAFVFRYSVVPAANWPAPMSADAEDRARRLAQAALVLALVASVARLAEATTLVASTGSRAWMDVVRNTQWGHGWLVGAAGLVTAGLGLSLARRTQAGWLVAGAGTVALMISQPLTGHAIATPQLAWMAVGSDFIHLGATGAWIGGLFVMVIAGLPTASLASEPERPTHGQRLVRAYHRVAVTGVVLTAFTGVVNAKFRLGVWSALWTSEYGRLLLAKTSVVVVLLLLGAYHWKNVVVPDWPSRSSARFRTSAALEIVAGAIVLALTAVLLMTGLPHP